MEDIKGKFVKSVVWLGSARFIGQAFSWLITIILVRLLSPQDFGIVAMGTVYQGVIVLAYDLNLGAALVQKSDLGRECVQTVFWFILALGIALYGVTILVAPAVAHFFRNEQLIMVLVVYGLGTLFQSFQQVPFWIMSKRLDFGLRAKAEFISNIASL
jgi:O-antigen/teichoic acid export membrane protein